MYEILKEFSDFFKYAVPIAASAVTSVWWLSRKFSSQEQIASLLGQKVDLGQAATAQLIQSTKDNLSIQIAQMADRQNDLSKQNDKRFDEVNHRLDKMESKYSEFEKEGSRALSQARDAVIAANRSRRRAETKREKKVSA